MRTTSPADAGRAGLPGERGFTLLEVMCAFAILAVLTGMLTMDFVNNVDKGTDALAHRELREAADSIFRKMLYEWGEYKDGDSRTLDEEYGEFASLKGWQRDRWAIYRYELEKRPESVVGTAVEGGESLFDDASEDPSTGTAAPTTGGETTGTGEGTESLQGIELVRMTLKIFRTDEISDEPLLTLTTWIDPERGQLGK